MDLRPLIGIALIGAGAAALCTAPACVPSCEYEGVAVSGGTTTIRGGVAYFESSPPAGPFIPFDGHHALTFSHKFGPRFKIRHVDVRLAFSANPEGENGGGWTFAAGNQAVVQRQGTDEIVVYNDQCTNYFVRVSVDGYEDGDGDASTDAAGDAAADADATPATDASDGG